MKPLSEEAPGLVVIQIQIQAVCKGRVYLMKIDRTHPPGTLD